MSRVNKTVLILAAIVALILGLTVHKVINQQHRLDPTVMLDAGIVLLPQTRSVPSLQFQDQDGKAFDTANLKGRWSLLFFGYTFCPDVCPTTLAQLRELQGKLPPEVSKQLQVIFVSVDPHRDTPARLKEYLGFFNAGFQGLVGSDENIQKLANAVSIPYIPADTSKPNYTVDHSGNLVIVGPDGTQHGFIRAPLNNAKLAAQLPAVLSQSGN
ncbi:SCO family protein [Pseudomonas panipatensis]|jgi:protein SCO1/2|uniref:SCO family protein n=1 Tax=Pseudomonas panipatensis TaxID=428992 RepID=UPI0035AFBBC9